jgi:phenylalanyl-tRNA synthetase alpha subunit
VDSDATHSPMFHQVEGLVDWARRYLCCSQRVSTPNFLKAFFEDDASKAYASDLRIFHLLNLQPKLIWPFLLASLLVVG